MRDFFISQDLWGIIEEEYPEPPTDGDPTKWTATQEKQFKENQKKDATALRYIKQGVSKSIYPRIFNKRKAKEAWEVLQKEFRGNDKVISIKLQSLWRDFDNLSMKESENIRDFFSRVSIIVNQIQCLGDTIQDKKVVEKILRSLPPKFDHCVAAIEESKDLSKLSTFELMSSLQAHEQRITRSTNQSVEQAFQSKLKFSENESSKLDFKKGVFQKKNHYNGGNQERRTFNNKGEGNKCCIICKKNNHTSQDCYFKCKRCRIPNHSQRDCRYQKNQETKRANFTKEEEEDQVFYSCLKVEKESQEIWYIDSGCSNHMTSNRNIFEELDQNFSSEVKLGDGKVQKVEGKGVIAVRTRQGKKKFIHDVLYVPNLATNLLSVGQLLEKGYSVNFDNNKCKIIDKKNNTTVANIDMAPNKIFRLTLPLNDHCALKMEKSENSYLWHLRYGHLNNKGLHLLNSKNMVIGLPKIEKENRICEGCIYGKMHRFPFPKTSWRAKTPLELVHADIFGPTRTPSLNNKRYFILFVDDFTRMMWIYFLSEKSEAFSVFLRFKALVERQSGHLIKTLRTDRGGEFIYNAFMNHCKDEGIQRQLTVKYSPQQNGVAERKNRTIAEMARSMLEGKNMPKKLWAEAVNTAVYILNRSPTKAVRNKTPFEAWNKRKPQVDHMKVFGCIAYALNQSPNKDKFEKKGERLVFIGYSEESKGYRLLNPSNDKLIISRDVIFDEMAAWNWEEDTKQATSQNDILHPMSTQINTSGPRDLLQSEDLNSAPSTSNSNDEDSSSDSESPVRKVRLLRDIYESSNVAYFACEPQSFEEAKNKDVWIDAMKEEISVIEKNKTWELVDLPKNKEVIGLKWVYKIKYAEDGSIKKHKARLVAKGYSQQPGVDFNETFAPVVRMETIRTALAVAAQLELNVYQLDVKSAFLNGELQEEVYVEQPQGFVVEGKENKVYRLRKALYGLKQAPRAWNCKIDGYFLKNGFERSKNEPSLYVKKEGTNFLIVCLYVDDLIYFGTDLNAVKEFKLKMMKDFEMTGLGLMRYFLCIQVKQAKGEFFFHRRSILKTYSRNFT